MSSRRIAALLFLIAVATVGSEARSDGTLDPNFNGSGKVITNVPHRRDDGLIAMAIQGDGKVLAAGYTNVEGTYDFAVVRYDTDGTLDGTFGTSGVATVDFGSSTDYGYAVAIQSDGKIVMAGSSSAPGYYGFAVARLNANGTLDATFGTGGKVTTHFGATSSDSGQAVAIQADGKIVVAGYSSAGGTDDFALARYNTNGSLDATFGSGGLVTTNFGAGSTDHALSVAIDASARIVAAGFTNAGSTYDFALARYATNGSLDATFGTGGLVTTNFVGFAVSDDFATSVKIQSDGRIVAAGNVSAFGSKDFGLARYYTNGTPDLSFGSGGQVVTSFGGNDTEEAQSLLIQSDGKLVAAGFATGTTHDFAVIRYNTNGSLDSSFGSGGLVRTDLGSGTYDDGSAVVIQSDGKIVVGGSTKPVDDFDFGLVRYAANGTVDTTYGSGGVVITNLPGLPRFDAAYAVAMQSDGKVVAAGTTVVGAHHAFAVIRYDAYGALDPTFGIGGIVIASFNLSTVDDDAYAVAIQGDGKIVVAGTSTVGYGKPNFALRRFYPDGSPDNTFGTGGAVWSQFSMTTQDTAFAVAIQSDGKIVAGGYTLLSGNYDFALMRYNTNGTLDSTFGTGGMVKTNFGGSSHEVISALALQTDGKIVVAGNSNFAGPTEFAIARYNTNGTLDPTFAGGGAVVTSVGSGTSDYANAVAVQTDGKIVVGGSSLGTTYAVGLARFNGNGTPDGTFGTGGLVRLNFGTGTDDTVNAIALQTDGKIVVGGSSTLSGDRDFALSRFNTAGGLDSTWGFGGLVLTNFGGASFEQVDAVAIQTDGRVIAAGYTTAQGSADFALARYIVCKPVTPFASNDGPICVGKTLHLYTTPGILDATYSWTGPGGFTSNAQNPTITNTTMSNAGDYSVTITPFGCLTSAPAVTTVSFVADGTGPAVTAPPAVAITQTLCQ